MKKLHTTYKRPFSRRDTSFRVLNWTAAWLNQVEFLQCKWNVCKTDADIYFIIEAGAAVEYYPTNGYIINTLKRSRQIASSILIGFKFNIIVSKFTIIHEMGQEDKTNSQLSGNTTKRSMEWIFTVHLKMSQSSKE